MSSRLGLLPAALRVLHQAHASISRRHTQLQAKHSPHSDLWPHVSRLLGLVLRVCRLPPAWSRTWLAPAVTRLLHVLTSGPIGRTRTQTSCAWRQHCWWWRTRQQQRRRKVRQHSACTRAQQACVRQRVVLCTHVCCAMYGVVGVHGPQYVGFRGAQATAAKPVG